jgi:hypothetical protein
MFIKLATMNTCVYREGLQFKIVRHENFPPNKKTRSAFAKTGSPPALAELIPRPQAEYQIGALFKLHLVMSFVKYPSI